MFPPAHNILCHCRIFILAVVLKVSNALFESEGFKFVQRLTTVPLLCGLDLACIAMDDFVFLAGFLGLGCLILLLVGPHVGYKLGIVKGKDSILCQNTGQDSLYILDDLADAIAILKSLLCCICCCITFHPLPDNFIQNRCCHSLCLLNIHMRKIWSFVGVGIYSCLLGTKTWVLNKFAIEGVPPLLGNGLLVDLHLTKCLWKHLVEKGDHVILPDDTIQPPLIFPNQELILNTVPLCLEGAIVLGRVQSLRPATMKLHTAPQGRLSSNGLCH